MAELKDSGARNMIVILVSGKAQHGKDTFANFFKEVAESHGKKVLIDHYADYLKYICKKYYGWNGVKDEEGRTLLQEVGIKYRKKDPNFWVNVVANNLEVSIDQWDYVLIPDTRFENEITVMQDRFSEVLSVRVERKGFVSDLTVEQKMHVSETALDEWKFDYVCENDGSFNFTLTTALLFDEMEDSVEV